MKATAAALETTTPGRIVSESHPRRYAFDDVLGKTARKTARIATPRKSKGGIGPLCSRPGRKMCDRGMERLAKGRPR